MVTRAEIFATMYAPFVLSVLALVVTAGEERVEATHTRSVTACELFVLTHTEVTGAIGALSVLTAHTGLVSALKAFVIADGHVISAHLTVYYLGLTARCVILTVAEVLTALGAEHRLTALTGKVTACKLIVLSTLTSRMSAGVKRVVKAVAKILAAALTE